MQFYNSKKLNKYIILLFVLLLLLTPGFWLMSLAKQQTPQVMNIMVSITPQEDINKDNKNDEDEEFLSDEQLIDENITTKIYKSTDPSLDLFELDTNLDPSIENDVLTKDELLKRKNKAAAKQFISNGLKKYKTLTLAGNNKLFPWLMLIVLILAIWGIFKVILSRKI